jgi:hypothetical protein
MERNMRGSFELAPTGTIRSITEAFLIDPVDHTDIHLFKEPAERSMNINT